MTQTDLAEWLRETYPRLLNSPITDAQRARIHEAADHIERLTGALTEAVEIIERHVPVDALGSNWQGNDEVPGGLQSWSIRDEYLHHMKALTAQGGAAFSLNKEQGRG